MTIIVSILAFFATIGILVAIHEYGHFWVARQLGVKVLRYSIGFGKRIWTYRSPNDPDKTEYALSLLPFGGYVKMLDEREGEVAPEELHRAFNRQPVWKRFLIVLAGPAFNFIFAIIAYAIVAMVGVASVKPFVGEVFPNTPASIAGLSHQDQIIAINGDRTIDLGEMRINLINAYMNTPSAITIDVETKEGHKTVRQLDLSGINLLAKENGQLETIGFTPWRPFLPLVGGVLAGGAAEQGGLKKGDKLLGARDKVFADRDDFIAYVNEHAGKEIIFDIDRQGIKKTLSVTPKLVEYQGKQVGQIGIQVGGYITDEFRNKLHVYVQYNPLEAALIGIEKTWKMSVMTLKMMGRLIVGEASIKNLSGPVTIANYAGQSILYGFTFFVGFLGVVSVSLGVLNLLPIPMLDGGHLFYYLIEMVKGSPVSDAFQEAGMRVGIAIVGCVMVIAFYNDIMRLIT